MKPSALLQTTSSVYFEHADKKYRYWYTKATATKPGKLKLHTSKALLAQFRTTRGHGTKVEDLVDICGIGSGWFEVTSQDFSNLDALTGTTHDGLAPWLAAWNSYFVSVVDANTHKAVAQTVAVHHTTVTVVTTPVPHPTFARRVQGTISLQKKPAQADRLNQLVQRFKK